MMRTTEEQQALQEFADASESEQKDMLFHSLMGLLADAVANDDVKMMKPYARLITEMYFDEGDE
jgi:hypothetical protein